MHKSPSLLLAVVLSGQVLASQPEQNWYCTFILGDQLAVTHTPTKIVLEWTDKVMDMTSLSFCAKSKNLFDIQASKDGKLEAKMSLESFREEVKKLGEILKEGTFYNWTKTFVLANGLEVTHSPELIIFKKETRRKVFSHLKFAYGLKVLDTYANGEGYIRHEMRLDSFRRQLSKFSPVVDEK